MATQRRRQQADQSTDWDHLAHSHSFGWRSLRGYPNGLSTLVPFLKVDICDVPDALGEGSPALKQRCFQNINECIEASREKRERVLVHCRDWFSWLLPVSSSTSW
ncbi:hypothetical protein DPEC_G00219590 [Dallia pectoralis]|uniref:Uncharacterized protein n=1 Tax=Dallia pectoralis TaxID=75939 RepID=A0ACC2G3U8_DALPE|nr:hypothetical protein DPEC_G00219590 [Dallia pectoralis]